jgi:hypothetical protein
MQVVWSKAQPEISHPCVIVQGLLHRTVFADGNFKNGRGNFARSLAMQPTIFPKVCFCTIAD